MTVKRYMLSGDRMFPHENGRWVHAIEFDAAADALEARGREVERLKAALEKIANSLPSGVYSYATDIAIAALAGQGATAAPAP